MTLLKPKSFLKVLASFFVFKELFVTSSTFCTNETCRAAMKLPLLLLPSLVTPKY